MAELSFPGSIKNSELKVVARKYLESLVFEMCEGSKRYFQQYRRVSLWHPLTESERSMYSLLATAASKISPVVLSEIPFERHGRRTSGYARKATRGRLDLWTQLPDGIEIALELKRVSIGLGKSRSKPTKRFVSRWEDVIDQADSATKQTQHWSPKTIRIGLLVVYGYLSVKPQDKFLDDDQCKQFQEALNNITDKLDVEPHWRAYWTPPRNMRLLGVKDNSDYPNHNPVIAFLAYVHGKRT